MGTIDPMPRGSAWGNHLNKLLLGCSAAAAVVFFATYYPIVENMFTGAVAPVFPKCYYTFTGATPDSNRNIYLAPGSDFEFKIVTHDAGCRVYLLTPPGRQHYYEPGAGGWKNSFNQASAVTPTIYANNSQDSGDVWIAALSGTRSFRVRATTGAEERLAAKIEVNDVTYQIYVGPPPANTTTAADVLGCANILKDSSPILINGEEMHFKSGEKLHLEIGGCSSVVATTVNNSVYKMGYHGLSWIPTMSAIWQLQSSPVAGAPALESYLGSSDPVAFNLSTMADFSLVAGNDAGFGGYISFNGKKYTLIVDAPAPQVPVACDLEGLSIDPNAPTKIPNGGSITVKVVGTDEQCMAKVRGFGFVPDAAKNIVTPQYQWFALKPTYPFWYGYNSVLNENRTESDIKNGGNVSTYIHFESVPSQPGTFKITAGPDTPPGLQQGDTAVKLFTDATTSQEYPYFVCLNNGSMCNDAAHCCTGTCEADLNNVLDPVKRCTNAPAEDMGNIGAQGDAGEAGVAGEAGADEPAACTSQCQCANTTSFEISVGNPEEEGSAIAFTTGTHLKACAEPLQGSGETDQFTCQQLNGNYTIPYRGLCAWGTYASCPLPQSENWTTLWNLRIDWNPPFLSAADGTHYFPVGGKLNCMGPTRFERAEMGSCGPNSPKYITVIASGATDPNFCPGASIAPPGPLIPFPAPEPGGDWDGEEDPPEPIVIDVCDEPDVCVLSEEAAPCAGQFRIGNCSKLNAANERKQGKCYSCPAAPVAPAGAVQPPVQQPPQQPGVVAVQPGFVNPGVIPPVPFTGPWVITPVPLTFNPGTNTLYPGTTPMGTPASPAPGTSVTPPTSNPVSNPAVPSTGTSSVSSVSSTATTTPVTPTPVTPTPVTPTPVTPTPTPTSGPVIAQNCVTDFPLCGDIRKVITCPATKPKWLTGTDSKVCKTTSGGTGRCYTCGVPGVPPPVTPVTPPPVTPTPVTPTPPTTPTPGSTPQLPAPIEKCGGTYSLCGDAYSAQCAPELSHWKTDKFCVAANGSHGHCYYCDPVPPKKPNPQKVCNIMAVSNLAEVHTKALLYADLCLKEGAKNCSGTFAASDCSYTQPVPTDKGEYRESGTCPFTCTTP